MTELLPFSNIAPSKMHLKYLFTILSPFFLANLNSVDAQVSVQDSLALVDFYNSTDGPNWRDHTNWNSSSRVGTWTGVTVSGGRVTGIEMMGNLIKDTIPASFGNLTGLVFLNLIDNQLSGSIPYAMGNLTNLESLNLGANYLTGSIPSSLGNLSKLKYLYLYSTYLTGSIPQSIGNIGSLQTLDLQYSRLSGTIPQALIRENFMLSLNNNRFNFADLEPFVQAAKTFSETHSGFELYYQDQEIVPIYHSLGTLSVFAGGTPANNTYTWYKDGAAVATLAGDSSYTPTTPGVYYATITNTVVTDLTLTSDTAVVNYTVPETSHGGSTTITESTTVANITDGLNIIATLIPTGTTNKLSGEVTAEVTKDLSVKTTGGIPYVQRHYDIEPASNANNATATIVLYFTQKDFDDYNSYVTNNALGLALLPTNKTDNGKIRITQYHGTFTGTPDPDNYSSGSTVFITPAVEWRDDIQAWTLTFPVTGFSGFFVSTAENALPLTLINFEGNLQQNTIVLQWQTANEIHTKGFEVERSADGNSFVTIGKITAVSTTGNHNYRFEDRFPQERINLYRLKIKDKDGWFTYSHTININFTAPSVVMEVYPNPATVALHLRVRAEKAQSVIATVTNATGATVLKQPLKLNRGLNYPEIHISQLTTGVYYLNTTIDGATGKITFLKK
ncbi:MAG: T9SS type A sorting domain-containing protein [Chitinophagaceae bacterium]|nr:T9SS type A sorting domain-containing protein [Chitinophagaceae bacterium]